ncbi:MAG TPA: diguanylate cyclase [Candidatus Saccharimonadales bacterium]
MNYPDTVSTARVWFSDLESLSPDGLPNSLESLFSGDLQRLSAQHRQCALAIAHLHVLDGSQGEEGPTVGQLVKRYAWVMRDLASLALVVRGPATDNREEYERAAQAADRIVAQTLERAYAENDKRRAEEELQRLMQLLESDALTGLPNHRGYLRVRTEVCERAKSSGAGVAESLVDLTNFKKINDELGHHIGDEALREVPVEVGRYARADDNVVVTRSGERGDEFNILNRHISEEGYASFLQRLRLGQIEKVEPRGEGDTPNARAWKEIARIKSEFEQRGHDIKAHTQVIDEEVKVNENGKEVVRTVRTLYIGSERIAPLRDITVLSVGGVYDRSGLIEGRRQDIEVEMQRHKEQLRGFMGAYRP